MSVYIEIPNLTPGGGGGGGGGGTWGTITGTLSNQTDLQNALNLLAPLANPTGTGMATWPVLVSTSTGSLSTPSIGINAAGQWSGFYILGGGLGYSGNGALSGFLGPSYWEMPNLILNAQGVAGKTNYIIGNSTTDKTLIAGDEQGDTTKGGVIVLGYGIGTNATTQFWNAGVQSGNIDSSNQWTIGSSSSNQHNMSGTFIFNNGYYGRQTNSLPTVGFIGESARIASSTFSNTAATTNWLDGGGNGNGLTITAGQWLFGLQAQFSLNGAVMTELAVGISSTSGNAFPDLREGDNEYEGANVPIGAIHQGASVSQYQVLVPPATTAIYYAKIRAAFTAGPPQYTYRLQGNRIS